MLILDSGKGNMGLLDALKRQSIGIVALFVALGGTGYAATKLPSDSVTAKQIKAGAVASSEIKNGSVTGTDVKNRSLTAANFAGGLPAGPQGAQGAQGTPGAPGAPGNNGAPGTARAYAFVNPTTCSGAPPEVCVAARAKGVTSVTRTSTGLYCVTAPGLDQASAPAIVSTEFGGTTPPQSLTSAQWLSGTTCGGGAYQVATVRNTFTNVRNEADNGAVAVAGFGDAFNNGVSFVIAIP